MSTDTIERYIQELEAIKNYPRVIQERDTLSQEAQELKDNLDNALKEIASLRGFKTNLDGANITLEEARLHFLGVQDAEIEKRAADRFERLKTELESEMPGLVYRRLCDILGRSPWPREIAELINTEADKKADVILRHQGSWPPWFEELYRGEVQEKVHAGLNEEFNAKVEAMAESMAREKLNYLISTHWPSWHRENVEPKIAELEDKIRANALQLIRGPWRFTCDQCNTSFSAKLATRDVEQLLKTGRTNVACANSQCEDRAFFGTRRHTFQVFLYDLIESHLMTVVISEK